MLDVLCLHLLHNSDPMAALTKEKPITADKNVYTKQADYTKAWKHGKNGKNIHYTKQYKCPEPLLQRHRNPDINYNKKQFKEEKHRCYNDMPNEENGEKEKQVPIKKFDKKINTSYTPFTLGLHVLIIFQHIYTLYTTPTSSIPLRFASFTQLVYVTTTCFHIATLLASIFKIIKLERAFVLYGTWVIWIGWAMCLWLIRPEDRPDLFRALTTNGGGGINRYYVNLNGSYDIEDLLAPMDVSPFLMHGKWSTTTLPIISFFLLLVIRRNHWGLITWEHLVLLDYSRTLKWYRTWCVAGAGAGWMLTWEAAKFWLLRIPFSEGEMVLHRTDLPTFPGVFNVLWASSIAGILMVCWWSFWTFQYRGVVWKKEFKEGVVVWSSSDGLVCVGAISC